jgi:hypothetical protein
MMEQSKNLSNCGIKVSVQQESSIIIDGVPMTTNERDVGQLYKTIMKPARRE